MPQIFRPGAVGALLDEYEKVIAELQQVLTGISDEELVEIVDEKATDKNCTSIQTILSHVIRSGYAYAIYIHNLAENKMERPETSPRFSIKEYQKDLNEVFSFTVETFANTKDHQLEEPDNHKKITTSWGQLYDIEQIMEHAIVHILRHRRQIEKFKMVLRFHR